jgi:hypothetical protein
MARLSLVRPEEEELGNSRLQKLITFECMQVRLIDSILDSQLLPLVDYRNGSLPVLFVVS